jgi:ribulose-5-phosphate 4-epimerase/fuculose-1-phosphate aldolase
VLIHMLCKSLTGRKFGTDDAAFSPGGTKPACSNTNHDRLYCGAPQRNCPRAEAMQQESQSLLDAYDDATVWYIVQMRARFLPFLAEHHGLYTCGRSATQLCTFGSYNDVLASAYVRLRTADRNLWFPFHDVFQSQLLFRDLTISGWAG